VKNVRWTKEGCKVTTEYVSIPGGWAEHIELETLELAPEYEPPDRPLYAGNLYLWPNVK